MSEQRVTYITLKEASGLYPVRSIATLRRERDKGNLAVYRIGNVDYTTHEDIGKMFEKCRVKPNHPAYSSANDEDGKPHTSSKTKDTKLAQASALSAAKKLKSA